MEEPRWLDGEEQRSWYALALLLNQLPAALDAQMQRDAGIGQFEYMVLSALSMAPERTMRMSLLAEYAGATLSRLSNVVSRLEKRGWVTRSSAPSSGRTTLATLTGDGLAVVEDAAPQHVAEVRRLVVDPLTKAQQRQLRAIASRVLRAIDPARELPEHS
ncbi:MarR family transcriptional regulator [Nonomuraea sp. K274]|uniref:MarR family transcriptional regulator n=1 Tax=Nonomuraea cypriaca TaxID=1187855 RepID=A0A931AMY7_9ACTN|nr:MarR family transcriptional regulator [Nonomuraea cypriaca]MBF8193533.1 MarR family transcriptional regulator [Nonomuraea cypriaca]